MRKANRWRISARPPVAPVQMVEASLEAEEAVFHLIRGPPSRLLNCTR